MIYRTYVGLGIIIAYPGQDVELLCNLTVTSTNEVEIAWIVNQMGPYGITQLHNGILSGYTATLGRTNLIVQNIVLNDVRNGSIYRCVMVNNTRTILDESDLTFLYVAGE